MKKVLSMMLAIAMSCSLITSAAAFSPAPVSSDRDACPPPVEDRDPDVPDVEPITTTDPIQAPTIITTDGEINGVTPEVNPYSMYYLYWARVTLDETPEIVYDGALNEYYLSFKLSEASKLAQLMEIYPEAFKLQQNLDLLDEFNSMNVIWEKHIWDDQPLVDFLSADTVGGLKALKLADPETGKPVAADAYTALKYIQSRPEYRENETLRVRVDYTLGGITTIRDEIAKGWSQMGVRWYDQEKFDTPAQLQQLVRGFLDKYHTLKVLGKAREIALSGKTSKFLATFEAMDAKELHELYTDVAENVREFCLNGSNHVDQLENARIAVPFPMGTAYQWPTSFEKPVNPLPTGATGG